MIIAEICVVAGVHGATNEQTIAVYLLRDHFLHLSGYLTGSLLENEGWIEKEE